MQPTPQDADAEEREVDLLLERLDRSPLERLKEKLTRPLGREDWIRFAGLVCLFSGAVLAQLWKPALGLGFIAYGSTGLAFDAMYVKSSIRAWLGPGADRIMGTLTVLVGAMLLGLYRG